MRHLPWIIAALLALSLAGCSWATTTETYRIDPIYATSTGPTSDDHLSVPPTVEYRSEQAYGPPHRTSLVMASSKNAIESRKITTGGSSTYRGEAKLITRRVEAVRIFSPFGLSPGETISRQTPMQVSEGPKGGLNITPEGVNAGPEKGDTFKGGGGKWGILDSIWSWIKGLFTSFFSILIVGIIALVVMYFIPMTRPIAMFIINVLAWIPKKLTELWTWIATRFDKWWETPPPPKPPAT